MRTFKTISALALCLLALPVVAANEINFSASASSTTYVTVQNAAKQFYTGSAFEAENDAHWSEYAAAATVTEQGASQSYVASMPTTATPAGAYTITAYLQAGGSPAETDTIIASGPLNWTGTAEVTTYDAYTQAATAATNSAANGTALTALSTKVGTPAGASVSADIAAAKTSIGMPQQSGVAVTLPSTAPSGYGGSGSAPTTSQIVTALMDYPILGSKTFGQIMYLDGVVADHLGTWSNSFAANTLTTTYDYNSSLVLTTATAYSAGISAPPVTGSSATIGTVPQP